MKGVIKVCVALPFYHLLFFTDIYVQPLHLISLPMKDKSSPFFFFFGGGENLPLHAAINPSTSNNLTNLDGRLPGAIWCPFQFFTGQRDELRY